MNATHLKKLIPFISPGASLVDSHLLHGGISSTMTAFTLSSSEGIHKKYIARNPGKWRVAEQTDPLKNEYKFLQALKAANIPAPIPVYFDPDGTKIGIPVLVAEYIEGEVNLSPKDQNDYIRQLCQTLANIHTSQPLAKLTFIPSLSNYIESSINTPSKNSQKQQINKALKKAYPNLSPNKPALNHGDFWPGNTLWNGQTLIATIDWEEPYIGDPLFDFAIFRMDLYWDFGPESANYATAEYLNLTGLSDRNLPFYDLLAARNPIGEYHEWAPAMPKIGRPDITAESMETANKQFIEQALSKLKY